MYEYVPLYVLKILSVASYRFLTFFACTRIVIFSVNHHHPKSSEIIHAGSCDAARRTKTSKWRVINKSTTNYNAPPPTVSPTNPEQAGPTPSPPIPQQDGTLPRVKSLGKDYCNDRTCGLCEGDCDNDDQCAGHLKCFQHNGGDEVPGCSGGRDSRSRKFSKV